MCISQTLLSVWPVQPCAEVACWLSIAQSEGLPCVWGRSLQALCLAQSCLRSRLLQHLRHGGVSHLEASWVELASLGCRRNQRRHHAQAHSQVDAAVTHRWSHRVRRVSWLGHSSHECRELSGWTTHDSGHCSIHIHIQGLGQADCLAAMGGMQGMP